MSKTKLILAFYPALLIASVCLTGGVDRVPRADDVFWIAVWSLGIPVVHLFALRRIRFDPDGYRTTAGLAAPFILLPFIGLVIGASVYLLLTYLIFTRGRRHLQVDTRHDGSV